MPLSIPSSNSPTPICNCRCQASNFRRSFHPWCISSARRRSFQRRGHGSHDEALTGFGRGVAIRQRPSLEGAILVGVYDARNHVSAVRNATATLCRYTDFYRSSFHLRLDAAPLADSLRIEFHDHSECNHHATRVPRCEQRRALRASACSDPCKGGIDSFFAHSLVAQ
jgi:hypothetical protein